VRLLFDRYPRVRDRVPFEPMVALPTPVVEHRGVWVKRDDRIGGNRYRKLEFYRPEGELLAWGPEGSPWLGALARHRRARVLTYSPRRNGFPFFLRLLAEMPRVLGGTVTLVPPGGSEPGSTLGFVNAALELAGQVARGECPKPDAVFVPLGTGGTTAGLALGFALAGLDVAVHAVRIGRGAWGRLRRVYGLVAQASWILDERPRTARLVLEKGFNGGYGAPLPEGRAAREFFRPLDLDAPHAAKAAACLLARRGAYRTPLLWLTGAAASPPPPSLRDAHGDITAAAGAPVP
jgi:D-cysteine desulfhydrase